MIVGIFIIILLIICSLLFCIIALLSQQLENLGYEFDWFIYKYLKKDFKTFWLLYIFAGIIMFLSGIIFSLIFLC